MSIIPRSAGNARKKEEEKKTMTIIITELLKYQNNYNYKKYIMSNSESVQCNFFIFDHVTFIPFKICCCVQNFIEIG